MELVDVVVGCDWSCAACSGWAAACMYRCDYGVGLCCGVCIIIHDSVDGGG